MGNQQVPICPECKSDHVLLDNLGGYRCSHCEYRWSDQQEAIRRLRELYNPDTSEPFALAESSDSGEFIDFTRALLTAYDQDTEKLRAGNVRLMSLLGEWFDAFGANCTGLSLADLRRRTLLEDGHE